LANLLGISQTNTILIVAMHVGFIFVAKFRIMGFV